MNRAVLAVRVCLMLCMACGHVLAEQVPGVGTIDPRVRSVQYDPAQVYRVRGFVGYQIHLEFERGEAFVGLAAGDLEGLGFSAVENNLFLKPKAAAVGTNLTVVTTRRHYHFDYTASAKRPAEGAQEVIYSLAFTYPSVARDESAAQIQEELKPGTGHDRNEDYWFCGHKSLKPIAAFDDGVHTWLRFDGKTEWPVVFVRSEDGTESLVNFTVQGDELILHRLARQFVLRRGGLTGCVVNKGFGGGSERPDSGTVSSAVRRETTGAQP